MKQGKVNPSVLKMSEWQHGELDGVFLSPTERRFLSDRVTPELDGRFAIDELRTGVRVKARSWVGVVRFEGFEVQIVPKLAGENLGLLKLIDYVSDLGVLQKSRGAHSLECAGESLLDLLALLFAEACERIVRAGLLSDYVEREGDLPAVRGRLLADRQVLRRFGRVDRVECRFDEYEMDILENRILAAALGVAARRVVNESVRLKLRRLLAVFDGVCKVESFNVKEIRSLLTYHRLNENYREAHELAWLLLGGLGVEDIYQTGSTDCFAFLLDMNRLFERFVFRWTNQLLRDTGIKVQYQARHGSIIWDAIHARPYARTVPDLLLTARNQPGRRLPLDAKYKIYDERTHVDNADIYQLFLYAYAFGKRIGESFLPSSALVYPASNPSAPIAELQVKNMLGISGARMRVIGIHIPTALEEAKNNCCGTVSQAFRTVLSESLLGA